MCDTNKRPRGAETVHFPKNKATPKIKSKKLKKQLCVKLHYPQNIEDHLCKT